MVNQVRQKRLKSRLGYDIVLRAEEEILVSAAMVKMCSGCIKGNRTAAGTLIIDALEF